MKLASAAVLFVALLAAPIFAQTADAPPPPPPGAQDHGGPGMHHGGPGMGHHLAMATRVAPVTNAPFSAKYTLESVQQAPGPDGVVQKYTATQTVYRDSLGRTREDVTMPVPPPRHLKQDTEGAPVPTVPGPVAPRTVTIIADPVANTITRLMPDRKVAVVETVSADYFKHAIARDSKGLEGGPMRHDGAAVTDLGSKTFAGVVASGKRNTFTAPARGAEPAASAGTDASAPAVTRTVTHETWFSPDLKLEVSSTETGGRGTRSDVLTSLTKGEPDAALFKVPEGYTVKNAPPHMPGGMHRGGRGPGGPDGGQDAPPPPPAM